MGGRAKRAESDDAPAERAGRAGEGPTGAWEALGGRVGSGTWARGRGKLERLVGKNLVVVSFVLDSSGFYVPAGDRGRSWEELPTPGLAHG